MNSSISINSPAAPTLSGPVLLFDGECGLCNRVVRLLLRLDRRGRLRYAPLQSPAAQKYLRTQGLPTRDFDSLVFVPAWERPDQAACRLRTDGALAALATCGWAGRTIAGIAHLVPTSWRDAAYRRVAKWRYYLFGVWKPRPLARPEWETRFLK